MNDHPTIDEILARNPQVDPVELTDALEALQRLREMGVRRKEFGLMPVPGGRPQRHPVEDDERADARLIRSRHKHGRV